MTTAFAYDDRFLEHDTGHGHPERRERLSATLEHLGTQSWFPELHQYAPRVAEEEWLRTVHAGEYLSRVDATVGAGHPWLDTPDCAISPATAEVARLAVGAGLELADAVATRQVDNGFALLRPPGHHAERDNAMGFCFYNTVAIVARYLQRHHGLERIVILDWDVHHGNGTQHSFEADPSVFYVSLHQYPYYPGTGARSDEGVGAGRGYTLNCPMDAGAGDLEYQQAFRERILPALDAYRPDAVLVSAGFDAHRDDPLAQIELSDATYQWMSERVMELADRHAGGRVISLLEGGYSLNALPRSVATHLQVLAGVGPNA